jgi:preprotein translocase subunit SecD
VQALGQCSVADGGRLEGWTVACDRTQDFSYVLRPAAVANADVATATATVDPSSTASDPWLVDIAFTPTGQHRFTELTRRITGSTLAFLLDGVVESAATVNTVIPGDAQIAGTFTESQARLTAALLGHGELPVPLHAGSSPAATPTG